MTKQVAVIGAGASGLTAIKCCLDEGLEPVCFDKDTEIGGLWNYREDKRPGHASVFQSTIINTSKEIMCYSDFPAPKHFPNFMHNKRLVEYFHMYADHFKLKKYINFNIFVESVKPSSDHEVSGKWDVCYKDVVSGDRKTETFDAVLVCSGHHVDPYVAEFPGQQEFEGKIVHTHDYKTSHGYENKRIVVIGIGNSGGDAAVELGRVASQVYLSTRRGSWVINRVSDNGLPVDIVGIRRFVEWIPWSWKISLAEKKLNDRFDHANYGLLPKHRFHQQHPMVNDGLPNEILSGRVLVKANVKRFTKNGVEFEDGTFEDNINNVIMATGYTYGFPFLDDSVIKVTKNKVSLYQYVFPPEFKHGTLAVIGLIQPLGAINPISEMQCRWATRVFKGEVKLPKKQDMLANIQKKKDVMAMRYVESQRHTLQVDYISYMDELADHFGVRPNIAKLFITNPKFAWKCFFGPFSPYQYRLMGPGKWDGAEEAINTLHDRVVAPTKTRPLLIPNNKQSAFGKLMKLLVVVAVLVAVYFKYSE